MSILRPPTKNILKLLSVLDKLGAVAVERSDKNVTIIYSDGGILVYRTGWQGWGL